MGCPNGGAPTGKGQFARVQLGVVAGLTAVYQPFPRPRYDVELVCLPGCFLGSGKRCACFSLRRSFEATANKLKACPTFTCPSLGPAMMCRGPACRDVFLDLVNGSMSNVYQPSPPSRSDVALVCLPECFLGSGKRCACFSLRCSFEATAANKLKACPTFTSPSLGPAMMWRGFACRNGASQRP